MLFFLFVIALVVVFAWLQKMRADRQRWLARLQLPGLWICEGEEHPKEERRTLDLDGGLSSGTYRSSDLGHGAWRLSGHTLLLSSDSHEFALDLIFYDVGKISLERVPGERLIYNKRSGNVIPLVRRQP
jgi:hypothetical protein